GLKGKVATIGGASMGIGYGIARTLALEGASIAITARREPNLTEAAQKLRLETGAQIIPIVADCRRAADCARVVETTIARAGSIDILINNDGAPPLGDLVSFDDTAWAKAVEQNLMYVIRMARAAVPHMIAQRRGGSILNITAISAIQPTLSFGLSAATWAGLIASPQALHLVGA